MIRQNSESKIRHIGHQICSKSIGKQKNWSVSRLNYTAKVSVGNTCSLAVSGLFTVESNPVLQTRSERYEFLRCLNW